MGIFKIGINIMGFAIPIIYEICLLLDGFIYSVADWALESFFKMAELSANTQAFASQIGYIMKRVMVLAGVFGLFRLAIMLINYIMDPSKIKEANKNGTDMVRSILVAIVLLVASPVIFQYLGKFQLLVINNGVIPKLVYGVDEYENGANDIAHQSSQFVNNVFLLFFTLNSPEKCSGGTGAYYCNDYIDVSKGNAGVSSLVEYASDSNISYTPFVSGIVGIMCIYYFVVFAIELGRRLIELIILQVLSPVPIIMSADPSQKNRLSTFVKSYTGLYLQIFIRLITMYLAFAVLGLITEFSLDEVIQSGALLEVDAFIKVLLYIGVFQAAKELPKLLEDALGLKLGTSSGQGFGAVLKGILGGAAGLVAGGVAGGVAGSVTGGGLGALQGAITGGASAMLGGAIGASSGKNIAASVKNVTDSIGKANVLGGQVGAAGIGGYLLGRGQNFFGGSGRDQATLTKYDADIKSKDGLISGHNKTIDEINKKISGQNDIMDTRTRADQLRGGIQSAMDSSFARKSGTLEDYISKDAKLSQLQEAVRLHNDRGFYRDNPEYRQIDLDRISERKMELAAQYEQDKKEFSKQQFADYQAELATGDKLDSVDDDFRRSVEEYNRYVSNHDMSDRVIESYDGDTGMEHSRIVNETDKDRIQSQINDYQSEIDQEKADIRTIEAEKERIEKQKKEFESSKGYLNRHPSEDKQYRPRN